ncbi:hypothetical protein ACQKIW_31875 [Bacillus thuringiensis]|uniref:hypothetical protein n=1 Tax=Bacillus thuringiensis TaxID=1428 RepID=UPI003D00B357
MNDNSNKDLLASLNVNPACVQPATINPNHFDQELLASLNLNPACLKPTDVVKITPVLIDGDVFYHAQLANGSLIVTSQENAAISLDAAYLPNIPSSPYEQWPAAGPITANYGEGPHYPDYVYLAVKGRARTLPYDIYGSTSIGENWYFPGYGPMQFFKPDFTKLRLDEKYTVDPSRIGDVLCYIGLMVNSNPYVKNTALYRKSYWRLLPGNQIVNRALIGIWDNPVTSGVSNNELNQFALQLGTPFNSPLSTIQSIVNFQFNESIESAHTEGKRFQFDPPGSRYPYNDYQYGVYQLQQEFNTGAVNNVFFAGEVGVWTTYSYEQYLNDRVHNHPNVKMPNVSYEVPTGYQYKTTSLWAATTPGANPRVTDNSPYNSQTF